MAETSDSKLQSQETERLYLLRRDNLRALAEKHGGGKWLAEKLGRGPSQISQLIGRRSHDYVKSKNIGNKLARDIEQKLGIESGWLDRTHDNQTSFQIPIIDLDAYSGEAFDPTNWPQSNLYITSKTRNLLDSHEGDTILLCCDNGMAPEINSGDILLCKRENSFVGDGIYVIDQHGHKYIRYINLYTDNDDKLSYIVRAKATYIDEIRSSDVTFVARVKEVWARKKY